jgi:hypothetical protein
VANERELDRQLRRLKIRGHSPEEIAEAVGRPLAWVQSRLDTLWRDAQARGAAYTLPTPQEIAERAAECRALWSEHDYRVRSGQRSAVKRPEAADDGHWTPPVVSLREITSASG